MRLAALLRGINVGGNKIVPMASLRLMLEEMGLGEPQTLLQSGNVVFEAPDSARQDLERRLETEIIARFGFEVEVMLRSPEEWQAIVRANPFPEIAEESPGRLLVAFLKTDPPSGARERLIEAHPGPEQMALVGRELFVHFVDGIGVSKLTPNLIESKLKVRATGRNWSTVLKIKARLDGS